MPSLANQPVQGGPTQPVYIMNGAQGAVGGGGGFGSNVGVACGTKAAAGNNTLIAAPAAGYRLVVWAFVIQNESATATTMILKDAVDRWRNLAQNQGQGLAMAFDAMQPWRLNEATALTFNLSGANQCGYNIMYSVEPV
jgi:hypothetical protein